MITCFNKNKEAVNNFNVIDNPNCTFNPGDSVNVSVLSGQFGIYQLGVSLLDAWKLC
jgi:hypothetical protein